MTDERPNPAEPSTTGSGPWNPPEATDRPLRVPYSPPTLDGPHSLDADETTVLALLMNAGTVPAALLHVRAQLPEGRARRAAQRLEHRSLLVRDGRNWRTA